jgi:hypothetical protein
MRGRKTILLLALLAFLGPASRPTIAQNASLQYLNGLLAELGGGGLLFPDNPPSYVLYELLEDRLRGLAMVYRNEADMLSFYRFEDYLLGSIEDLGQAIRELLVEAGDATLADSDREIIRSQIDELYGQMFDTLSQAEFNTLRVFAALAESPVVKTMLKDEAHYKLDNVDRLLGFFASERTILGARSSALEFSLKAEGRIEGGAGEGGASAARLDASRSMERDALVLLANLLMLGSKGP